MYQFTSFILNNNIILTLRVIEGLKLDGLGVVDHRREQRMAAGGAAGVRGCSSRVATLGARLARRCRWIRWWWFLRI